MVIAEPRSKVVQGSAAFQQSQSIRMVNFNVFKEGEVWISHGGGQLHIKITNGEKIADQNGKDLGRIVNLDEYAKVGEQFSFIRKEKPLQLPGQKLEIPVQTGKISEIRVGKAETVNGSASKGMYGQSKALLKENADLKRRLEEATGRLGALTQENTELKKENVRLGTSEKRLQKENELLGSENRILSERIKALEEKGADYDQNARINQGGLEIGRPRVTIQGSNRQATNPESKEHERLGTKEASMRIMDENNKRGMGSPVAKVEGLSQWLAANAPKNIKAEVLERREDYWLLAVIYDEKTMRGCVIPALDIPIGAGILYDRMKPMFNYEVNNYDGTSVLMKQDIDKLPVVEKKNGKWVPESKGDINRKPRQY